jgi:sn-glycerol 3-phosphate transport system substrate-binding protein
MLPGYRPLSTEGTPMKLKIAVLAGTAAFALNVQAQTEVQWWHSMTGANGDRVNAMASGFNASQKNYKVVPVYKGNYDESMTAAIAAFRAGKAPNIVQVFEVGTATMMGAKGAIIPTYKLMKDSGEKFDPKAYVGAVAGYYTDSRGNMLSFPFNSSTPVFYINKDAFKKAGLDANAAPKTWTEFAVVAGKLKANGQECVYTTGWPSWVHVENFSAWHNLPIGTMENGIAGLGTKFTINSPQHVEHLQMLVDFAKNGWFTYAGRRNEAEARFFSGECAMLTSSSAAQGNIRKNAKFEFSVNFLPYNDAIKGAPQNSIIGGASLWVLSGKPANENKGVAQFFNYLSAADLQSQWHKDSGYVPITNAAAELTKASGYYEQNPGTDIAVKQLNFKAPTANSKGLRFGNFVQGRTVIEEEMESALAGKKSAKQALDDAVQRGNDILRKFESTNKGG